MCRNYWNHVHVVHVLEYFEFKENSYQHIYITYIVAGSGDISNELLKQSHNLHPESFAMYHLGAGHP